MNDSYITVHDGRTTGFVGKDAVMLYQAAVLMSSLKLLSKGIQPTRGFTMKRALAMAKQFTGQTYKRTEWERAQRDLKVWCETMKSALPVEVS